LTDVELGHVYKDMQLKILMEIFHNEFIWIRSGLARGNGRTAKRQDRSPNKL